MLLAATCAGCGRRGSSPCPDCHARLRPPVAEPDPPGLAGMVVLLRYDGPARPLVARIKYRGHRQALGWLAAGLADRITEAGHRPAIVTWAPTTSAHRRARGFDHGELLARRVGRELGVPVRSLLVRRRGPAQTGRHARERLADGPVFDLRPGPGRVALIAATGPVLVVDDVVTTGATLRSAVTALRGAGAHGVVAAALARTPRPRP